MTEDNPEQTVPLAAGFPPAHHELWLKLVEKVLGGRTFSDRLVSRTSDGIAVEPLHVRPAPRSDDAGSRAAGAISAINQGASPGIGWQVSQRHVESDPRLANAAILDDLANGAGGVTLQTEAPGQFGLPTRPDALRAALKSVTLAAVRISLLAGDNALDAAGALLGLWTEQETPKDQRRAACNADPLGVVARSGALTHPVERAVALAAKFCADPVWEGLPVTTLLADGRPYHEAGGSEAQELAAMLATLVAYLRACEAEGLSPDRALPRIAMALAADADLFLTIAKLRAARLLVRRVAEACGITGVAARLGMTVATSERMMVRRDPWVNLLRTTAACAGAAFGGADAITVLPFTWALGRPDAFARRLARNTQIVLQEEAALGRVADPAAGSWYVEKLTEELARTAWTLFQEIEAGGGMAAALRSGFIQDKIAAVAAKRETAIADGRELLTGVSAFPLNGHDGVKVEPHPVVPPVAEASMQVRPLTPQRLAAPFEHLRDAADTHKARTGKPPQVFLASLGTASEHGTRSTWAQNFLAAGGIEALAGAGYDSAESAVAAFKAAGAAVACLASSDHVYERLGLETARALKAAGARHVIVVGRPGQHEAALRAAGVDEFLFAGGDAVATLRRLHEVLDVRQF